MTVYYMQDGVYNFQQTSKVTAFKPVRNTTVPALVLDLEILTQVYRGFVCSLAMSTLGLERKLNDSVSSRTLACRISTLATLKPWIFPSKHALLAS